MVRRRRLRRRCPSPLTTRRLRLRSADPVAAVQNVFGLWGSGALTREASAPLVASDVHLDAKDGYPWVHPGYKVYHGLDGWMEWLDFLSHTHFQDFTPHQFRPADGDFGPGLSGVTALATYTPTNMKTWKSAPMQADTHTWIVDSECKIADVHFHWSDPQALDELWAGCDKVNLINWVFATWGGQSPYYPEGWNAAATEHFATPDSVTDASGGYAWEHATGCAAPLHPSALPVPCPPTADAARPARAQLQGVHGPRRLG